MKETLLKVYDGYNARFFERGEEVPSPKTFQPMLSILVNDPEITEFEFEFGGKRHIVDRSVLSDIVVSELHGEYRETFIDGLDGRKYRFTSRPILKAFDRSEKFGSGDFAEMRYDWYEYWTVGDAHTGRKIDVKIVDRTQARGHHDCWDVCLSCGRIEWITIGDCCADCAEEEVI